MATVWLHLTVAAHMWERCARQNTQAFPCVHFCTCHNECVLASRPKGKSHWHTHTFSFPTLPPPPVFLFSFCSLTVQERGGFGTIFKRAPFKTMTVPLWISWLEESYWSCSCFRGCDCIALVGEAHTPTLQKHSWCHFERPTKASYVLECNAVLHMSWPNLQHCHSQTSKRHCHAVRSGLHQCVFEVMWLFSILLSPKVDSECPWMGEGLRRENVPFLPKWKAVSVQRYASAGCSLTLPSGSICWAMI